MGKFLTKSEIRPIAEKGMYRLTRNELYKDDDGTIYLAWRGFRTDNFTWLKNTNWDIRCSHIHDVGCKYHQVVIVTLNDSELCKKGILKVVNNEIICKDIPTNYLKVENISGKNINNLFYRMLKSADCPKTPKHIQVLYRMGVSLNLNWFSKKSKIDINKLYDEEWNELK